MAVTAAGRRSGIDRDRPNEAVDRIVGRWPTVGLAVGLVTPSGLEFFRGQGLADIASGRPVTTDTIFRIADAITGLHLEAGPLSFPRVRP